MLITRGQPLPDSADAADFLESRWTPDEVRDWLRERLVTLDELRGLPPPPEEPPHPADAGDPPLELAPEPGSDLDADDDGLPFTCLGHDHGRYYYLARGAKQVLDLTGPGHTKAGLLMLAPLSH